MNFKDALSLLEKGESLYRKGWDAVLAGDIMHIDLIADATIHVHAIGKMRMDITLTTMQQFFVVWHQFREPKGATMGAHNVWTPTTADLIADDWELFR